MNRLTPVALIAGLVLSASCSDRESPTVPRHVASLATIGDYGVAATAPSEIGVEKDQLTTSSLVLPFSGTVGSANTAFSVTQTGSGQAAMIRNTSSTNTQVALNARHGGSGIASYAQNYGTGMASSFEITNANNASDVLRLASAGGGNLLHATQTTANGVAIKGTTSGAGVSVAGRFWSTNASNTGSTIEALHSGTGVALTANSGNGIGGAIGNSVIGNNNPGLRAYHHGTSNAAHVESGQFSTGAALRAETYGTGAALLADQHGFSGDIAVFRAGAPTLVNQARIDRTGKGFFNGGTQTGGADVAESFEVDGHVADLRPGDVLVISTRRDRRVARSAERYSTHVIGVYATKPGVLLTERGIDESQSDMVPVGVVGVIPTRVSAENGAIRRGDILVTAATPGHAMRTDPVIVNGVKLYPTGAILGKALQEFAGPGRGLIKVLVNVK
ncbi:MAG: hypothetical protein ACT4P6_14085 [Gemmatimonadaceae bacterium]